jgi:alpha-1,6-mannosyltransferase
VRGIDPVKALLLVGANPLYVIYALGGAHNDLLMMALMMVAVALTFAGRDGSAAATVVAGALVKATVAALLPFMILARRSLAQVLAALGALALGAVVAYAVFGVDGVNIVAALNRDAAFVSTDSFPTEIAHLFGKPGVFPIDHDLLKAALVIIVLHLLWRTWRGYDWVAASGWALLAISVTSTWLLAWYILWPLPLAVIARDRRLLVATLAIQALFVLHQTTPLWAPVK